MIASALAVFGLGGIALPRQVRAAEGEAPAGLASRVQHASLYGTYFLFPRISQPFTDPPVPPNAVAGNIGDEEDDQTGWASSPSARPIGRREWGKALGPPEDTASGMPKS